MSDNRWLGPPVSSGIEPEAVAMPQKKGKWKWEKINHTAKQEAKRKQFFKAMKEADQNEETNFDY